jgi:hypothetical protein
MLGAAAPAVFLATCRFCSRPRHPHEFIHDTIVGMCWHCYEAHQDAMRVLLEGGVPTDCAECRLPFDELSRLARSADVRMRLHWKDGLYQFLCRPCSDAYERKRLDQFGNTPYGEMRKLRGAK